MKILKILLTSALLLFSVKSMAVGLFLEPGIFYEKGDNNIDWPSPLSSSTGTTKGFGVDLKLGLHWNSVVFLALDGTYSKVKFENSATDYSADATSTTYGAVIGGQFPVLGLRAWGGYVFGGKLDPDEDGGYDVKFEDPKGLKVGVGFKIFFVSINVEYMDLKYDKSYIEKPTNMSFDNKLENKVGMVSLSFPLSL